MIDSNISKPQNPNLFDFSAHENYGQYDSIPVEGINLTN